MLNKQPLTIIEFGDTLLKTGDLDPVYTAIANTPMSGDTKDRLCLAYWCFYHLGVAAHLAEIKDPKKFWAKMHEAAVNEGLKWPRGSERRHFRAANATKAMACITDRYKTPDAAVDGFVGGTSDPTFQKVSKAVQTHVGFGPWIAFKIADMSERVLGYGTTFDDCHLGIYKDPRQGAAVAYLALQDKPTGQLYADGKPIQPWEWQLTDDELASTVTTYVNIWRKKRAKAPPSKDRLVNIQEIETIFCKYKSHLKGHYPVGKDTAEIRHGLDGWGDLAQQLKKGLPHGA